ncbi:hypothetical protein [Bacteroides propionicifaciens]|uniref:hypothetical protein n=1 Tax=Bacteroides propionicifaciens TaxID=392838 RepID=UPI0003794F99|nr:hypothetical protein [Bacteroides propionicifaciens]
MNSKKKGLSTQTKHETNPFMIELKGKMYLQPRANTIIARGESIVDTSTGQIVNDTVLMGRRKVVDKSQFAKIYASEIGSLFDLSRSAINVFMYLTKVMDYDQRAYFNYFKEYAKVGYKSFNPCYKGILELINNQIIALDVRENTYWLNPTIVCKGERFAIYTEYITKEKAESIDAEKLLKANQRDNAPSYDNQTQKKIDAMNKIQEDKYLLEEQKRIEEWEKRQTELPFD